MSAETKKPSLYNKVGWKTAELGQLAALLKLYKKWHKQLKNQPSPAFFPQPIKIASPSSAQSSVD